MTTIDRRQFLLTAAAVGASAAWADSGREAGIPARERRDLYPQGVASGDPDDHSVLLWTRRPFRKERRARLVAQVSENPSFSHVIATASARILAESDWTCRVLVGNLRPARAYWYRFIDEFGNASRIGRTLTAPTNDDTRPMRFAFAACQNLNQGVLNGYRRMIFEDERAPEDERLAFVLHLGDFVYECVWYPEDNPQGLWGRTLHDILHYPNGEKIGPSAVNGTFHIPTTLEDYRVLYRAYLRDPDLQDARARWPFVCMWDNHEFSLSGWQSVQPIEGENRPAQTLKVAANQAWFEYQPARLSQFGGGARDRFPVPPVRNKPITLFDDHGFGDEPNNRAALASLTTYRAFRWGKNAEIILTDQRSYRSEPPLQRREAAAFRSEDFLSYFPEDVAHVLDAGRDSGASHPPAHIRFGDREIPNFQKDRPPQTLLGFEQKRWFLRRLTESQATWKIWGNSQGTLEERVDFQNLPAGMTKPWPGEGYAINGADYSVAVSERAEIYASIRRYGVTGFATVSGDRHSFWAGLAAAALPPASFEPVGVAFVTGSLSTPGMFEYLRNTLPASHPLRPLFISQRAPDVAPEPTINMLSRLGVSSCLEYDRTGDIAGARRLSNPQLAPHLAFLDFTSHGYATVRVSSDAVECEFVGMPRPINRQLPDGGAISYRVVHRAPLWKPGQRPQLEQRILEGSPGLSL